MGSSARLVISIMLVCAIGTGIAACGNEASLPPDSTTTALATLDKAGAEAVSASQDYKDAMSAWVKTYWYDADGQPVHAPGFKDVAEPTHAEIAAAREFAVEMRDALTAVKRISPPAEVAHAHAQYCSAFSGELSALDRMISAIEWGSARDAELAYREAEKARTLEIQALKVLGPYYNAPDLTQN
jgi:hypothetical protein